MSASSLKLCLCPDVTEMEPQSMWTFQEASFHVTMCSKLLTLLLIPITCTFSLLSCIQVKDTLKFPYPVHLLEGAWVVPRF